MYTLALHDTLPILGRRRGGEEERWEGRRGGKEERRGGGEVGKKERKGEGEVGKKERRKGGEGGQVGSEGRVDHKREKYEFRVKMIHGKSLVRRSTGDLYRGI